jgi:hypothetical protein
MVASNAAISVRTARTSIAVTSAKCAIKLDRLNALEMGFMGEGDVARTVPPAFFAAVLPADAFLAGVFVELFFAVAM